MTCLKKTGFLIGSPGTVLLTTGTGRFSQTDKSLSAASPALTRGGLGGGGPGGALHATLFPWQWGKIRAATPCASAQLQHLATQDRRRVVLFGLNDPHFPSFRAETGSVTLPAFKIGRSEGGWSHNNSGETERSEQLFVLLRPRNDRCVRRPTPSSFWSSRGMHSPRHEIAWGESRRSMGIIDI